MSLEALSNEPTVIAATIAIGVFLLVVSIASAIQLRLSLNRRISNIDGAGLNRRSLARKEETRASELRARISKWLTPSSASEFSDIRRQLVQAGFFSPAAVYVYFGWRIGLAICLAAAVPVGVLFLQFDVPALLVYFLTPAAGLIGLQLPGVALDRFRAKMRTRYRNAFPDFTDLLVVCVEAGQSLQGAMDRVSQESVQFCPELGLNLHLMNLELRAGRSLAEGLKSLNERLGIDEIKSLGLLLTQSEELGSSIAATLRVFSDEMRDKRLMRAEEKAHALPVKLTLPLGIFIFPVILMVILTPVFIRMNTAFN